MSSSYSRKSRSSSKSHSRHVPDTHGSYFCDVCSVKVDSLSIYETHLRSQDHLRRLKPLKTFICTTCNVEVSSFETLESHYVGESHRRQVAKERSKAGDRFRNEDERRKALELNRQLKKDIAELQDRFKVLLEEKKKCQLNHRAKIGL